MRLRPAFLSLVLGGFALVGAPAVADGPVTVGATSTTGTVACSGTNTTTWIQDSVGSGSPSFTVPGGTVITAWTAGVVDVGTIMLKVVKEGPDNTYTVVASTPPHEFTSPGTVSVPVRVPVPSSGNLAMWIPAQLTNPTCEYAAEAGDVVHFKSGLNPEPLVGETVIATSSDAGRRVNLSATVEPDADSDGYGDLTQDLCPRRADRQTECQPPDTTAKAKKKVFTSKRKAKVRVKFAASEPGATFVCTVDGKARGCQDGKLKLKLKLGKHRITVAAVDVDGNADATPVILKVKVRPRR